MQVAFRYIQIIQLTKLTLYDMFGLFGNHRPVLLQPPMWAPTINIQIFLELLCMLKTFPISQSTPWVLYDHLVMTNIAMENHHFKWENSL